MRSLAHLVVLLASLAAPTSLAYHLGPDDVHGVHVAGVFEASNAADLPVATFDGIAVVRGIPVGEGGGPNLETTLAYERAYAERVNLTADATVELEARVGGAGLEYTARIVAHDGVLPAGRRVRLDLTEEGLRWPGTGRDTPFFARANATRPVDPGVAAATVSGGFPLASGSRVDRLALVASLLDPDGTVEQAAAWRVGQEGATHQVHKAVLVRLASSPACDACVPAEKAFRDLVAGLGPEGAARGTPSYARPFSVWSTGAAVAGGALAFGLLRPKRPGTEVDGRGV